MPPVSSSWQPNFTSEGTRKFWSYFEKKEVESVICGPQLRQHSSVGFGPLRSKAQETCDRHPCRRLGRRLPPVHGPVPVERANIRCCRQGKQLPGDPSPLGNWRQPVAACPARHKQWLADTAAKVTHSEIQGQPSLQGLRRGYSPRSKAQHVVQAVHSVVPAFRMSGTVRALRSLVPSPRVRRIMLRPARFSVGLQGQLEACR